MELTLEIEDSLYDGLSRRADEQGFESTEAYCAVILETVLTELEGEQRTKSVEQHLEDLGYL